MKKHEKKPLHLGPETIRNLTAVTGAMESTTIGCIWPTTNCVSTGNPKSGCTSCPSCGDCGLMKP